MIRILIAILLLMQAAFAANVPPEIEHAISEALSGKWNFQYFERNKISMGFNTATTLKDIKAGDPFQLYSISQIDFEEADDDIAIDSLIKLDCWYVPTLPQKVSHL